MVLDDLSEFIRYSTYEFLNRRQELFGAYAKRDLIEALRNSETFDTD